MAGPRIGEVDRNHAPVVGSLSASWSAHCQEPAKILPERWHDRKLTAECIRIPRSGVRGESEGQSNEPTKDHAIVFSVSTEAAVIGKSIQEISLRN